MPQYEALLIISEKNTQETISLCCKLTGAVRVGVIVDPEMIADLWVQLDEGIPDGRVLRDPDRGKA